MRDVVVVMGLGQIELTVGLPFLDCAHSGRPIGNLNLSI